MDPAFSRRCYHLGSCFFSVPIICRYFLFFGIDSSPVPGSFFSAGIPFLDFKGGCFYPFGFCAVVFSACIRRFCPVTAPFSDLGASRFLSSFCPALDTFLSSRRWCLPYGTSLGSFLSSGFDPQGAFGFLSFTKMNEVMSAVRGTARMTPMLLAMPLMTSVAI